MKKYTKSEDRLNVLTHALGLFIMSYLMLPLIIESFNQKDGLRQVSLIIYFIGVAMMFLSSSLYHGSHEIDVRKIFRLLDHSSIPICIASTYTPVILLSMEGLLPRIVFVVVWVLAIISVFIKLAYFNKKKPSYIEKISIGIFLIMGWVSLVMIKEIINQISIGFFKYLLFGGLAYTIGVLFYKLDRIPYNHAIWHVFILVGTFSIYLGINKYIL